MFVGWSSSFKRLIVRPRHSKYSPIGSSGDDQRFIISVLISAAKVPFFAAGILLLLHSKCDSAELYQSAEGQFQSLQIGALDDFDQQWIQNQGYKLHDPKAVTTFSMKLRANNSICESGLEVQYFEDSECKGKFCRMTIKCGPSMDPRRPGLTLKARKDIAIASWNFEPDIFDFCVRQAILVSTPSGPVLVIIGRYGFEIGDPKSSPPQCWDRKTF
jgi:hypothetical protein